MTLQAAAVCFADHTPNPEEMFTWHAVNIWSVSLFKLICIHVQFHAFDQGDLMINFGKTLHLASLSVITLETSVC